MYPPDIAQQPSSSDLEALARREAEFYETRATAYDVLRRLIRRSIGEFARYREAQRYFDPAGKRVLAYAPVPSSSLLLERGAVQVTGIDVSASELELARDHMERLGYGDRIDFLVADAHRTPFDDDSFDLIVGGSVLHHLELRTALQEIRRILRPGGRAVFHEPLGHNPLIQLGRAVTPAARTSDEHPLTVADWKLCREIFPAFEHRELELVTVAFMPLNLILPRRWQSWLVQPVFWLDDWVLSAFPRLRRYARLTILVLE
jgi:ubiquinone/menaquinone biosynthesis C-methylase UbiE